MPGPQVRNEANRKVCGATAIRKCETKPIRRGRVHAGVIASVAGRNALATGAERSQSHFRTVWQSGNPLCFQYKTGVKRFDRMCMNRLAETVVTPACSSPPSAQPGPCGVREDLSVDLPHVSSGRITAKWRRRQRLMWLRATPGMQHGSGIHSNKSRTAGAVRPCRAH